MLFPNSRGYSGKSYGEPPPKLRPAAPGHGIQDALRLWPTRRLNSRAESAAQPETLRSKPLQADAGLSPAARVRGQAQCTGHSLPVLTAARVALPDAWPPPAELQVRLPHKVLHSVEWPGTRPLSTAYAQGQIEVHGDRK